MRVKFVQLRQEIRRRHHILFSIGIANMFKHLQNRNIALQLRQRLVSITIIDSGEEIRAVLLLVGINGGSQHRLKGKAVFNLL